MNRKHVILTTLLALFVVSGLWAQDKYEYGVIRFDLRSYGNDTLKTYIPKNLGKGTMPSNQRGSFNYVLINPKMLISEIERYQSLGWEVYKIYKEDGKMNYSLRRKTKL